MGQSWWGIQIVANQNHFYGRCKKRSENTVILLINFIFAVEIIL
jgi:hypothetical protein